MRRTLWAACACGLLALLPGCATGPLLESPLLVQPIPAVELEANPVFVPQGPVSYRKVFEHSIDVLRDFGFEILEANLFEGRIDTLPRVAPGVLQFLKPGNPDPYERLLATFQTYRHRARIMIQPAQLGGFFIEVTVWKELEDLPRPVRSTEGVAIFRADNNVERQFTVIDPTVFESNWIPKGYDHDVEQVLLRKLKCGF